MSGNDDTMEWNVHASGRTNLGDPRIPIYWSQKRKAPYFIMYSTRYTFPLRKNINENGTVEYMDVNNGDVYSTEWYDKTFHVNTKPSTIN